MRLHELHPSLVHAPLVLLPAAALTDVAAIAAGSRVKRFAYDAAGRRLWWAGVGSALVAGLAGMAASQEVETRDAASRDAIWLHGTGNVGVLLTAAGLASWRSTHRASPLSAALGVASLAAAAYTAWLGGEIVYGMGVGVEPARPGAAFGGDELSPPLLSSQAPGRLAADAMRGLGWLATRLGRLVTGKQRLAQGAASATPAGAPGSPAEPAMALAAAPEDEAPIAP